MDHLLTSCTQSMDWDEALATLEQACPELADELDLLDQMQECNQPIPDDMQPLLELVFLLRTDPPTYSRH